MEVAEQHEPHHADEDVPGDRGLGLSMEEMVDRLRAIRLAVVAKETGPELVLEQMSRDEAELVNRFGLLDLVPTTKSAAT